MNFCYKSNKEYSTLDLEKKLLAVFIKKNCRRPTKNNSELKKELKGKQTNYMSNGKDIATNLIAGLIKRIL